MKYKRLNSSELENLKDDFIRFLASQGIDAEAWQKMKSDNVNAAEEIINIYSDLVYDQALSKCNYMEHVSAKEFKSLKFEDSKTVVKGIKVKEGSDINLNTSNFQESVQIGLQNNEIEVFTASKSHEKLREQEMFDWIEKGGYMADEKWFNEVSRLIEHLK
ncbi:MAG: DUF6495 family protein [Salibacteraceae bacterium]